MNKLLLPILFLSLSCTQTEHQNKPNDAVQNSAIANSVIPIKEEIDTLLLRDFDELFKQKELKTYNISTNKKLHDSISKSGLFWKSKRFLINDTLKQLAIQGFPLSLKTFDYNVRRITTVTESENLLKVLVFTLDKTLKTISYEDLTFTGGDAGISGKRFGKFINDSLYTYKEQTTVYDSGEIESEFTECLVFHKNGIIELLKTCP